MSGTTESARGIAPGDLTGAAFIRRLETLFLLVRRVLGGSMQADRKSTRKGTGITFADYAEYRHGDDYRAIDWRVYARFDELVVKLFELEEDATVYILLDLSHSMASKTGIARRLAAALGYIGLNCQDRVAAYETATPGYTLMDANLTWHRDGANGRAWEVFVDGRNLANREARPHTSVLKDEVPLPGRSVGFGVRAFF